MANAVEDEKITAFLEDVALLSAEQHAIITNVRALFLAELPAVEQVIKYGDLAFFVGGKICGGLYSSKHHVTLEMSNGSWLVDPDGLLEGKGKTRRHLKLRCVQDIADKKVAHFTALALKAAVEANVAG